MKEQKCKQIIFIVIVWNTICILYIIEASFPHIDRPGPTLLGTVVEEAIPSSIDKEDDQLNR